MNLIQKTELLTIANFLTSPSRKLLSDVQAESPELLGDSAFSRSAKGITKSTASKREFRTVVHKKNVRI